MDGKLLNDILGAKFGTKHRAELILRVEELTKAVESIIWMARRYADGRKTYAPSMFNDAYDTLREELGDKIDKNRAHDTSDPENPYYDITIESSKIHPYATSPYDDDMNRLKDRKFYKKP